MAIFDRNSNDVRLLLIGCDEGYLRRRVNREARVGSEEKSQERGEALAGEEGKE